MASRTVIFNDSDGTISLIPFSRYDSEERDETFQVRTGSAINIAKKTSVTVNREAYDLSGTVNNAQIHMLFRAGEFLGSVKPLAGEKLFVWADLAKKTKWNLSIDAGNQVNGGPGKAVGQTSSEANAAGPQDAQLRKLMEKVGDLMEKEQKLMEEVQQLKQQVEILQNRVADLEAAPKNNVK